MKNKILWVLAAVFVVSIISLGITYAYRGSSTLKGPNYDANVENQLEAAMGANDYDTWLKIRQDNNLPMNGKIFQVINKDNFARYVEMHKANLVGDRATVETIRAELGLGEGCNGGCKGTGNHNTAGTLVHTGCLGNHESQVFGSGSENKAGGCTGMHKGSEEGTGTGFVDINNDGVCDNKASHHPN